MKILKKIFWFYLFLILFLLVGCNFSDTKKQLMDTKPKDFNFIYNYGVDAKNELDTNKGQYIKDMVTEPPVTTDLILSDEEMNTIYSEMMNINILNYPENFKPKSNQIQTPFNTYSIKIIIDGKEKNISWKDENISKTNEAIRLRELFTKIKEIIISKEEFKKLPEPKNYYE